MLSLKRNKQVIYLSKVDDVETETEGMMIFEKPVKVYLNIQPVNRYGEISALGATYVEYLKAIITNDNDIGNIRFEEHDRAYVYVDIPSNHDKLASTADYRVTSALRTINQTEVMFKRVQKR